MRLLVHTQFTTMLIARAIRLVPRQCSKSPVRVTQRLMTTATKTKTKKEGDISSVFVSLSGGGAQTLPERFAEIKRNLISGHEDALIASWNRLLAELKVENDKVARLGPAIVPSIEFEDLDNLKTNDQFMNDVTKRGCAVIRGVIDEKVARNYKTQTEAYVKANPHTRG